MKAVFVATIALLVGFGITVGDAEAARFGGGKSFGSKPFFSQPQKRVQPNVQRQPQQAPTAGTGQRRSGLMGLLGGLAMGGLIGALLFGGAFEHINPMDILVFAIIAFVLYKVFASRRQAQRPVSVFAGTNDHSAARADVAPQQPSAAFDTDLLFKKEAASTPDNYSNFNSAVSAIEPLPQGFDTEHFLEGAKAAYERLQRAWDMGDLSEIRQFTTDKVFGEIQDQLRARNADSVTQILNIQAHLQSARDTGTELEAAVMFSVNMREEADAEPILVHELWHFVRPKNSRQPTWYLDGIQQIED